MFQSQPICILQSDSNLALYNSFIQEDPVDIMQLIIFAIFNDPQNCYQVQKNNVYKLHIKLIVKTQRTEEV